MPGSFATLRMTLFMCRKDVGEALMSSQILRYAQDDTVYVQQRCWRSVERLKGTYATI